MTDRDNMDDLDDQAQLDEADTLLDRGVDDPLDEGISPPDRPWAVNDYGTTAGEEAGHEDLDHRLARELPNTGAAEGGLGDGALGDVVDEFDEDGEELDESVDERRDGLGDGIGDTPDTDGEPYDDQVGEERAGRLVAHDEGGVGDTDPDAWAEAIGIDGAGASAEEAAVHVVDDEDL